MVFNVISTAFQLYLCGHCNYPCFPEVLLTSTLHHILQCTAQYSFQATGCFSHNHSRNNVQWREGINPVSTTIINPRKKYWLSWGSNQQPPVLKSGTLPTGLWGLAHILWIYISSNIFVKLLTPSKDKELRCCKVEFQLNEKCFQQTFGTAFLFHP